MQLEITDIQRGCTHDGPGLRTTVFFKGCPLRCKWCHNPETLDKKKQVFFRKDRCVSCMACAGICPAGAHILKDGTHSMDSSACTGCMACTRPGVCPAGALSASSRTVETQQVLEEVLEDRIFYRQRGGMTLSGGEPTAQKEGMLQLLRDAKREGIHTCLETCGVFPASLAEELVKLVDLFLYDVKDTDPVRHRENTGGDLEQILSNLRSIDAAGGKTVLRCVLIPEVNLGDDHALQLSALYHSLRNCQYIELLPYHPYGLSKAEQLGREQARFRLPGQEELDAFAAVLLREGVPCKQGGTLTRKE